MTIEDQQSILTIALYAALMDDIKIEMNERKFAALTVLWRMPKAHTI